MAWLTGSLFGIARWIWFAGAIAIIVIIIAVANHKTDKTIEIAKEAGSYEAVSKGQQITLDQVSKANEANTRINNAGDPLKYDTCLRDSAPGYERNCERYKPDKPLSN